MGKDQSHKLNTDEAPGGIDLAAAYVRVSSFGQLGRGDDEDGDGYSLPAQTKACKSEAEGRGAKLVKVYPERAASARSDERPALQEMMEELPALGVRYLIVHKVDRLARNRLDDAQLYQRLLEMGITLVSATENIDETPAGRLMHGMLASFAEYYSNNLSHEVKKGMHQKHANGGTPYRPPVGYLSHRKLIAGQDIRTVVLDPDRAPLVKQAFDLYSTGEWGLHDLTDYLRHQGLRSRGTSKSPGRPLDRSYVHKMLTNPYYVGIVRFCGKEVPGRHERLISDEVFDRVQDLLAANNIAGSRAWYHRHFLRGTVFCEECKGRLLFGRHKNKSSNYYEYFSCTNRAVRRKTIRCTSGHYAVDVVESEVEDLYAELELKPEVQDAIRRDLAKEIGKRSAVVQGEADRHERAIKEIEGKQAKLIELYYQDLVSRDVFQQEQVKLKTEQRAAEQLRSTASAQLQDVEEALEIALGRVNRPHETYLGASELERRLSNRAVFKRIDVGEKGSITGTALTPVYQALSAWEPDLGRPKTGQEAVGAVFDLCAPPPAEELLAPAGVATRHDSVCG